jgi:hypothetical protein
MKIKPRQGSPKYGFIWLPDTRRAIRSQTVQLLTSLLSKRLIRLWAHDGWNTTRQKKVFNHHKDFDNQNKSYFWVNLLNV